MKMRKLGYKVIAGIHDDNSLEKLKNLDITDHQSIEQRMTNIKPYSK